MIMSDSGEVNFALRRLAVRMSMKDAPLEWRAPSNNTIPNDRYLP
jgi:hypothetical protein